MSISALVHTYNEESNIQECLQSLSFVDEIVVVDNASTDRTPELAQTLGARVKTFPGVYGYPEPARVFGLTQVQGDWVLILDADERVTPELAAEIRQVTQDPLAWDGYFIPIRNYHFGRWLRHGRLYPDWHMRLFRLGKGSYPEVGLHRGIQVVGRTGYLHSDILHYSYRNLEHYFEKFNRYTTVEAERMVAQGHHPTGYDLVFKPLHRLIKSYICQGGFCDGLAGLLYHVFSAAYVFVSEAKAWDTYRQQGQVLPVLSTLFKRKRKKLKP